jgi:hypothetical protein
MKIENYKEDPQMLIDILLGRLIEIEQRERIVLKFPFGHLINRIEIYCGETEAKTSGYFGDPLPGITTIQVFTDYTNKAQNKSSYSYKNELLGYIPKLIEKCINQLNQPTP